MSFLEILPILGYAAAIGTLIWVALANASVSWRMVALLGAAMIAFSIWTVAEGGLLPFWFNHTTNLAGNQVWFDLLISVVLAFVLLLPRARAQGMAILPWALAVASTASIALLIMMARLLWLEQTARERKA
jgi:hypothetical protein